MDARTLLGGGVAAVATSPVVLVGDVAVGVMLPTVAGVASRADFSEVVAADAISLADAGRVTVGVTDLADAGAAPQADAGMAFPTDPAGVVTIGVAPLADAGIVTVGVADLADAGIPIPADPAGTVTVGVADLADVGIPFPAVPAVTVGVAFLANTEMVAVGVTDLADAVASLADAGMVTIGVTDLADPGMAFPADLAGRRRDTPGRYRDGRHMLRDTLGLLDFSADIDPGSVESFPRSGSMFTRPVILDACAPDPRRSLTESGGIPDGLGSANDCGAGSRKPFPKYGGVLSGRDSWNAIENEHEGPPYEYEARLRILDSTLAGVGRIENF